MEGIEWLQMVVVKGAGTNDCFAPRYAPFAYLGGGVGLLATGQAGSAVDGVHAAHQGFPVSWQCGPGFAYARGRVVLPIRGVHQPGALLRALAAACTAVCMAAQLAVLWASMACAWLAWVYNQVCCWRGSNSR